MVQAELVQMEENVQRGIESENLDMQNRSPELQQADPSQQESSDKAPPTPQSTKPSIASQSVTRTASKDSSHNVFQRLSQIAQKRLQDEQDRRKAEQDAKEKENKKEERRKQRLWEEIHERKQRKEAGEGSPIYNRQYSEWMKKQESIKKAEADRKSQAEAEEARRKERQKRRAEQRGTEVSDHLNEMSQPRNPRKKWEEKSAGKRIPDRFAVPSDSTVGDYTHLDDECTFAPNIALTNRGMGGGSGKGVVKRMQEDLQKRKEMRDQESAEANDPECRVVHFYCSYSVCLLFV